LGIVFLAILVGFAVGSPLWGLAVYFGTWLFMRSFTLVAHQLNFVGRVIRDNRHIRIEGPVRVGNEIGNPIKVKTDGS
jgi:hypothetical protein